MVVFDILRRDLLRYWRNPIRTALLFAVPLVMAGVFALAFGGGDSDQITITVLLFDEDDSLLSRLLEGAGDSSRSGQKLEVVPVGEEGYEMMERGEASALVHLPEGFTADYLDGNPTTIGVVKNPSERFLPKIVDEGVRIGAVGLSEASQVFRAELAQMGDFAREKEFPADLAVANLSAGVNQNLRGLERFLFPPVVTLESVSLRPEGGEEEEEDDGFNILAYVLPGFSIMGILFLAQSATRDILRDRESGLLRHLLTAPVSVNDYLGGKCLSVFAVTILGFTLFVLIGIAAGIHWGPAPAVVALMLASALATAGLLILIMSLVGSERQGDTLTTMIIIVSSMLGGAFLPVSQMPSFLKPISASTLVYWSTEGFSKLIIDGGGLADIVPNLAVLTVVGLILMLIGAVVLKRKIERGAV
jgi:ABC-2 type transport system permease protein